MQSSVQQTGKGQPALSCCCYDHVIFANVLIPTDAKEEFQSNFKRRKLEL